MKIATFPIPPSFSSKGETKQNWKRKARMTAEVWLKMKRPTENVHKVVPPQRHYLLIQATGFSHMVSRS